MSAHRRRDERGVAAPAPVAMLSVAAVALAALAFVVTSGRGDNAPVEATPVVSSPTATPTPTPSASPQVVETKKPAKKKPAVRRGDIYVEVYNNSGIGGLAATTGQRVRGAGWQVVGEDNWYGTISASTVYYPERLQAEAKLLARDLGIARLKPAIAPMKFDRLTVILTTDYS